MLGPCWYCSIPDLCDACVVRWIEIHRGNAAAIGRSWARAIISRTADRAAAKPWPAGEGYEAWRATGAIPPVSV